MKNGGLWTPDLSEYSSASKIMWTRTKQTKHKLKNIASVIYPIMKKITSLLSTFALTKDKWESIFGTCFHAFKLFYYRIEPNNSNELLNERIKNENKLIMYTNCIGKGVYNLTSFLGNTGGLLTFTELRKSVWHLYWFCNLHRVDIINKNNNKIRNTNSSGWQ